jgi:hypothetical protein
MANLVLVVTTSSMVIKQHLIVAGWHNELLRLSFNTTIETSGYSTTKDHNFLLVLQVAGLLNNYRYFS